MKNISYLTTGYLSRHLPVVTTIVAVFIPAALFASEAVHADTLDLTTRTLGYLALAIFAFAYILVTAEDFTQLRKSKPVIIAAGLILGMIGWVSTQTGLATGPSTLILKPFKPGKLVAIKNLVARLA